MGVACPICKICNFWTTHAFSDYKDDWRICILKSNVITPMKLSALQGLLWNAWLFHVPAIVSFFQWSSSLELRKKKKRCSILKFGDPCNLVYICYLVYILYRICYSLVLGDEFTNRYNQLNLKCFNQFHVSCLIYLFPSLYEAIWWLQILNSQTTKFTLVYTYYHFIKLIPLHPSSKDMTRLFISR